ncbi:MAG: 50S ribosomal protein L3, partial [Patescibacteria group bacterium]|nr:50S ribosomal protein L3 [Patescibacteria group bacterium]
MLNALIGIKDKMSQTFLEGKRVSFTVVKADTCVATRIDNVNGKYIVQLSCGKKKVKNISKSVLGQLKDVIKDAKTGPKFLREVVSESDPGFAVGDKIQVEKIFKKGDVVAVTGVSKGKG